MAIEKDELIAKIKEVLKPELTQISYETWILPLGIRSIDGNHIIFTTTSEYQQDFIENKYRSLIFNTLRFITNMEWTFSVIDISKENKISTNEIIINDSNNSSAEVELNKSTLNPKYTFETFVVGNNNRFAHAAALAVGNEPSNSYNPLFLYGGVGLGKTHLMHAIGNRILENNKNANVLYVTSEKFTNQLINAIKDNKNEFFRNKYRTIDVLLIDDIQFIAGKERVQEEFFHTFNELHEAKKQIVISSDKHPREIATLEERLRSRFEWGITADIQPPDYETKMAILKKRAELEHLDINQEVMQYVATNINSNIRELEGALNKIYVFANLEKKPVTLELAENALKDTIECQKEVTPQLIMDVVAEHYNISVSDIISKKKNKEIANPRQICMYLSRKYTDYSLQNIGKIMGNRDHTTVIHGHDKIGKMLETDENLKSNLDIIIKKLNPPT